MGVWTSDLGYNIFTKNFNSFNNLMMIVEIFIIVLVGSLLLMVMLNLKWTSQFYHWMFLELIWTAAPMIILIILGFPSLKSLYTSEMFNLYNNLNLKILGHQWYWEYSMPEIKGELDCYPVIKASLYRLGEAEYLMLPFNCKIRGLITSQDVIHSWSLPSLAFKMDACPGRLNYFMFMSNSSSFMIGQCSELCGAFHSWMPICLEFSSSALFMEFLKSLK